MTKTLQKLLNLNALVVAIALVSSVAVGTVAVVNALVKDTPLLSGPERQEIESIVQKHPIWIGVGAGWVLGTTIAQVQQQVRKAQQEYDNAAALVIRAAHQWAQRDLAERFRTGELEIRLREDKTPRIAVSLQCRHCQYLGQDVSAYATLVYPCAVRPYGPDSEGCPDWQAEDGLKP